MLPGIIKNRLHESGCAGGCVVGKTIEVIMTSEGAEDDATESGFLLCSLFTSRSRSRSILVVSHDGIPSKHPLSLVIEHSTIHHTYGFMLGTSVPSSSPCLSLILLIPLLLQVRRHASPLRAIDVAHSPIPVIQPFVFITDHMLFINLPFTNNLIIIIIIIIIVIATLTPLASTWVG